MLLDGGGAGGHSHSIVLKIEHSRGITRASREYQGAGEVMKIAQSRPAVYTLWQHPRRLHLSIDKGFC